MFHSVLFAFIKLETKIDVYDGRTYPDLNIRPPQQIIVHYYGFTKKVAKHAPEYLKEYNLYVKVISSCADPIKALDLHYSVLKILYESKAVDSSVIDEVKADVHKHYGLV